MIEELKELYASIQKPLPKGSPTDLIEELDYRCQWLARSSEIFADAQRNYDRAKGLEAGKHVGTSESWNIVKSQIEGAVSEEKRILALAERLNSTLSHQLEAIRSMLSFIKADLHNTR